MPLLGINLRIVTTSQLFFILALTISSPASLSLSAPTPSSSTANGRKMASCQSTLHQHFVLDQCIIAFDLLQIKL